MAEETGAIEAVREALDAVEQAQSEEEQSQAVERAQASAEEAVREAERATAEAVNAGETANDAAQEVRTIERRLDEIKAAIEEGRLEWREKQEAISDLLWTLVEVLESAETEQSAEGEDDLPAAETAPVLEIEAPPAVDLTQETEQPKSAWARFWDTPR